MTAIYALTLPDTRTLVQVLGVFLGVVGILLCIRVLLVKKESLTNQRIISLGLVSLPAVAVYKLLALGGLVVVPTATVGVAGYHLFDGIKDTQSCMQCHVMHPMGNDMHDPASNTLAARHFKNKWIPDQQCYHCHTDYGLGGTLQAKLEGFRHLSRYTTKTYTEPIRYRSGTFNNHNCLHCHEGTPRFKAITSHGTVWDQLEASTISCLNCHGAAHPTREARTPGHPDYQPLMGGKKE